ncbi:MAG: energy transducer TonB [Proteobacteria bacterium]|nr:energy transducer TonB [Pseudomonadota bacterium]
MSNRSDNVRFFCMLPVAAILLASSSTQAQTSQSVDGASCKEQLIAPRENDSRKLHPPKYPTEFHAKDPHRGIAIVHVRVDANGSPAGLRIQSSSGYRELDQSALATVRTWTFEPATLCGRAIDGELDVPVTFRLSQ